MGDEQRRHITFRVCQIHVAQTKATDRIARPDQMCWKRRSSGIAAGRAGHRMQRGRSGMNPSRCWGILPLLFKLNGQVGSGLGKTLKLFHLFFLPRVGEDTKAGLSLLLLWSWSYCPLLYFYFIFSEARRCPFFLFVYLLGVWLFTLLTTVSIDLVLLFCDEDSASLT